jgi:hypothetical protein
MKRTAFFFRAKSLARVDFPAAIFPHMKYSFARSTLILAPRPTFKLTGAPPLTIARKKGTSGASG